MQTNSFKYGKILTIKNCSQLGQISLGQKAWTAKVNQGIEGAKMTVESKI